MLTKQQWNAVIDAVTLVAAGEWDENTPRPNYDLIIGVLNEMRNGHVVLLTPKELALLNHGLDAGIMDDGIEHIGLTRREQKILGRVGNRLLDLAGSNMPRYHE